MKYLLLSLICCLSWSAAVDGLTCQLFLSGATVTPSNVTCNASEYCGRIEVTTNGSSPDYIGTRCYASSACNVDAAGCIAVAGVQFGAGIPSSEQILSCSAACCFNADLCNQFPISTWGSGATGLSASRAFPAFLFLSSILALNAFV